VVILGWNIYELEKFWKGFYTEKIQSEAIKTVYKSAILSLSANENKLHIETQSGHNKEDIQKNSALIHELKTRFNKPDLILDFMVVEPPEIAEQRRRATLNTEDRKREDELPLLAQNPLIQKLKDILGLEIKKP
jgi:hypothetical protein